MEPMKPPAETHEGPEAFERFRTAVKTVLSVSKSAVQNPFKTSKIKKRKPAARLK
jgi:hypothetical protein